MQDIGSLIRDTSVHAKLYCDPDIFEQEMERIFSQGWVYVGHDSEIPRRGDYVRRTMGLEPVLLTRGGEGIHVVANRCTHRGNLLCQAERGNRRTISCQYHGWVFASDGELLNTPMSAGTFEESQSLHLKRATVDTYNGFIFATFNPQPRPLLEHLGHATAALDRQVNLSPEGAVELRTPWVKHLFRANWKMLSENEADGYHVSFVHNSFARSIGMAGKYSNIMSSDENKITAVVRYLGNGHTELDYGPTYEAPMTWLGVQADRYPDYTRDMKQRYGETAADEIMRAGPPHTFIFPNLFLAETCLVMIQPLAVGETVNWHTPLYLKGVPPELNRRIMRQGEVGIGPSSFLTADDAIIAERQWRALKGSPGWLDLSRGLQREYEEDGVMVSHYTDETPNRGFWRCYSGLMTGTPAA